ncbi:MAG: hypothetical protein VR69_15100 [Peptococcaceae bacterium BRH_c4b]|nr:MAG: hypothetical protein VR69_15100 [Peptococcaceae bacterium BRH_c4b]
MQYNFIPAALAAAGLSWLTNGFILRLGRGGLVYLAPAAEEVAKTGLALAVGASVPATHIFFGLLEALWDGAGKKDVPAGAIALLSHTVFGLITFFVLHATGAVWPALTFAYLAHVGWNTLVLHLTGRKKGGAGR